MGYIHAKNSSGRSNKGQSETYCFGERFVKVLTAYWYTIQCVRTQRSHTAELLLNYIRLLFYYCREPSSCMIVGPNKSYYSMKQSIILHENFDKPFAIAIVYSMWERNLPVHPTREEQI